MVSLRIGYSTNDTPHRATIATDAMKIAAVRQSAFNGRIRESLNEFFVTQ
jgi:hypothetical protein